MDLEADPGEPRGEVEGAGRVVDRVAVEHDEGRDLAPGHRLGEGGERLGVEDRHRRGVEHGLAARRGVEAMHQRVQGRPLPRPGHRDGAVAQGRQGRAPPRRERPSVTAAVPPSISARRSRARRSRSAEVAGTARSALAAVSPARAGMEQGQSPADGPAGLDPVARQPDLPRPGIEEVAVEGDDPARPSEAPAGLQWPAEGEARARIERRAPGRVVDVPAHRREIPAHPGDLRREGGERSPDR